MKITLINPSEIGILDNAGDRPALGLLYMASSLRNNKHEVNIIDGNHIEEDDIIKQLKEEEPDFVGITFTTPLFERATNLSQRIHKELNIPTVAGGHHASAVPEDTLKYFTHVIVGEGETGFEELLNMKTKDKQIIIKAKPILNLDKLSLPARDKVDMNKYNMIQEGKRTATLMSSRGCTGFCVYCSRKSLGNDFRAHSPKYVEKEILELMNTYGYKSFYFYDDMFTRDRERVMAISKKLKKYKINFRCTTRADCVDYEMLKTMKEGGLDIISLGIEHADNKVLRRAGKGMTIQQNEQVIKWCDQLGIKVKGFFIINLPGATKKTALKTLRWAKKMKLHSFDFYPLTAYPGAIIWDKAEALGMRLLDDSFKYFQAGEGLKINIDCETFPKEEVEEVLEVCLKK